MALVSCPECNREISDAADICPHCGYKLSDEKEHPFEPVVQVLSKTKKTGLASFIFDVIGGRLLIATGIPLVTVGIGVIMIILGIIATFGAFGDYKKHQYG